MGILRKASRELWPQSKVQLGRRTQPSRMQESQQGSLGTRREDGTCQTVEAKQEPSFASNAFSKQVRGSWAGTQLKGISLSLSSDPKGFYLSLPKHHLASSVSAKGRQKLCQSPGPCHSGPIPAAHQAQPA